MRQPELGAGHAPAACGASACNVCRRHGRRCHSQLVLEPMDDLNVHQVKAADFDATMGLNYRGVFLGMVHAAR